MLLKNIELILDEEIKDINDKPIEVANILDSVQEFLNKVSVLLESNKNVPVTTDHILNLVNTLIVDKPLLMTIRNAFILAVKRAKITTTVESILIWDIKEKLRKDFDDIVLNEEEMSLIEKSLVEIKEVDNIVKGYISALFHGKIVKIFKKYIHICCL